MWVRLLVVLSLPHRIAVRGGGLSANSHFCVLYPVWRSIFTDCLVINSTQLQLLIDIAKVNPKHTHLFMQYNNWLNNDLLKMSKIKKNVFWLAFLCFVPCLKIIISRSLYHKLYPTIFVNRYCKGEFKTYTFIYAVQ